MAEERDKIWSDWHAFNRSSEIIQSTSTATNLQNRYRNYDQVIRQRIVSDSPYCTLEFYGASRGNPGPAGAGAILRTGDESATILLREGVGIATSNVAEYRAVILGLKHAHKEGFKHILVQGDSNLVCMQIQGLWAIRCPYLVGLCKEAQELLDNFTSAQIRHIPREQNSEADAQANQAVNLRDGQIEEQYCFGAMRH